DTGHLRHTGAALARLQKGTHGTDEITEMTHTDGDDTLSRGKKLGDSNAKDPIFPGKRRLGHNENSISKREKKEAQHIGGFTNLHKIVPTSVNFFTGFRKNKFSSSDMRVRKDASGNKASHKKVYSTMEV
ncbi:hypothetical protein ACJX0J_016960, partial [Zea mays]